MKRILSIGALCATLVLTSCGDKTFTVTFDSKGGSAVAAITDVMAGEKINAPAAPTKEGFDFIGWYKETACTNAWIFASDVVNSDITLYAKWEELPQWANTLFIGDYYGDYYANGTHNFDFELYFFNGDFEEGFGCYVDFNAATNSPVGTYTFLANGPDAAGTFNAMYVEFENEDEDDYDVTGGTLKITASEIQVSLTCTNGTHNIKYTGVITWDGREHMSAPARAPRKMTLKKVK